MALGNRDMKREKLRNPVIGTVAVCIILLIAVLYYREFFPDKSYEYRDLDAASPEFREAERQLQFLRQHGIEHFTETYVHPKCRDNPILKYALEQLLAMDTCHVDAADAFGKRIVRITIKAETKENEIRFFAFLLSRGREHLQWETPNL